MIGRVNLETLTLIYHPHKFDLMYYKWTLSQRKFHVYSFRHLSNSIRAFQTMPNNVNGSCGRERKTTLMGCIVYCREVMKVLW